ncbi:MAG TPA: methyltransferase [Pyrinomonadaceae bacterium]|nr:methyltransferase [Pyrinomonadaceae bacterium]
MSAQLSADTQVPPPIAMLRLISGFWISRGIYIAAKLGLADLIRDGARTADDLAVATGTHAPSLFRVLRALASVGIFTHDEQNRFGDTPLLQTLRSGVPGSLRAFAMTELGEEHYPAWGELLHSVKTGGIAFDHAFGTDVWKYFAQHPDNAKIFNDAMSGMTAQANEALHAAYDFAGIKTLVDIGGGHGGLITSILRRNPEMRGILFDSPPVIEGARPLIESSEVAGRCEPVAGNFFESVPEGADAHIMKWIIHDWDDDQSVTILRNSRRALAEGGKLILVEAVVPAGNEPHFSKFIDLNMLVMTGGRERTEAEFRDLYERAGFRLTRVVPTESPFSVIEGLRV